MESRNGDRKWRVPATCDSPGHHYLSPNSAILVRLEAEPPRKRKSKSRSEAARVIAARLAAQGDDNAARQRLGSFSMIAAIAERPSLLDPVRAAHDRIWKTFRKTSKDPELALLAWLALEGLLFVELFGTSPLSKADRAKFLRRLTTIAD